MTRRWRLLLGVIPAAFLLVFFVYPVATLLATAFVDPPAGSTTSGFSLTDVAGVLWFTLVQAVLSTVLTLAVALPGCWVLARYRFRGSGAIEALSVVAFVMPTVVVAAAISATLADTGPLSAVLPEGANRGLGAILTAHVYFNLAVVLRMVSSYWAQLDRRPAEVAACLGAPPWRVFASVTLPMLRPAILAAAAIVFLFTFTSFGIVLLLGGPGQATMEVEIQRQVLFLFDLRAGALLSVLQIVVVLAILLAQTRLASEAATQGSAGAARRRPPRGLRDHVAVGLFLVGSGLLLGGPVLMVVARAFGTPDGWSTLRFQQLTSAREGSILFVPPAEAIWNSVRYATLATVLAVLVGGLVAVLLARRVGGTSLWEGIWLLPLGVSAVTLGFGVLIAFDTAPLAWRGSFWMVPVVQALVAIPFVVRALVPALQAIGPRVREAAALLGASPARVWWHVDLPLVARALAVAVGFSFAISLGEFGATVFVARGDHPTVPVAIYRLLGTPGAANQGQAMALATVLIALTAAAVLLTDRLRLPGQRHV